MRTDNIKKFIVREVGHLVLHHSRHMDRKIVSALLKHSDGFHLSFDTTVDLSRCYFRFTFWKDGSEPPEVDTEFDYVLGLDNETFTTLKAALVEALGKVWYIKDELNDETESISDLFQRESATIDTVSVGKNGYLSIEFLDHPESTMEAGINHILEAYIPEDLL